MDVETKPVNDIFEAHVVTFFAFSGHMCTIQENGFFVSFLSNKHHAKEIPIEFPRINRRFRPLHKGCHASYSGMWICICSMRSVPFDFVCLCSTYHWKPLEINYVVLREKYPLRISYSGRSQTNIPGAQNCKGSAAVAIHVSRNSVRFMWPRIIHCALLNGYPANNFAVKFLERHS